MTTLCDRCRAEVTGSRIPLTLRQRQIYDFIVSYMGAHRVAPSCSEIAEAFRFSSLATVVEHLENLTRKGWITRRFNEERAIELVDQSAAVVAEVRG